MKVTKWTHSQADQSLILEGSAEESRELAYNILCWDDKSEISFEEDEMTVEAYESLPEFEG